MSPRPFFSGAQHAESLLAQATGPPHRRVADQNSASWNPLMWWFRQVEVLPGPVPRALTEARSTDRRVVAPAVDLRAPHACIQAFDLGSSFPDTVRMSVGPLVRLPMTHLRPHYRSYQWVGYGSLRQER